METELRWIEYGSPEYDRSVLLRYNVLREPLGLAFTEDQLAAEWCDLHLCACHAGDLVGCLVLTEVSSEVVQMRQVAVDPAWRGEGIGRLLVAESERTARRRGFREMMLHARDTAVAFYVKLGYEARGEVFEEVGIPHREMAKEL